MNIHTELTSLSWRTLLNRANFIELENSNKYPYRANFIELENSNEYPYRANLIELENSIK